MLGKTRLSKKLWPKPIQEKALQSRNNCYAFQEIALQSNPAQRVHNDHSRENKIQERQANPS